MTTSTSLFRRVGLVLLGLGIAASAIAFSLVLTPSTGLPTKWQAGNIPVRIMLGTTPVLIDGSNFNTSAQAAAQTWNNLIGSTQIQTTVATGTPREDNDISEMAFTSTIYGRAFDPGVLAVTLGSRVGNERIEADILFNSARGWDSYRDSLSAHSAMDLRRVATHELGHLLGLDHPDDSGQSVNAIMNSHVSDVNSQTTDDTNGAQALYGPPNVPANDNFANAFTITLNGSRSVTLTGYNTKATKEAADPRQGDNPGGRSVWWRWTAPSAGNVTLDTKGSYYDTTLGVYTGASLATLTKIADNDDIDPGVRQNSSLTFAATAGTEYRIDVDGYNGIEEAPTDTAGADNAGITLNLTFDGSLGTAPAITAQPASASVSSGGNVSFSVTATGSAPLAYQWLFNSNAISGATSSAFSLATVSSSQAGTYSVTVSNSAGSVTSSGATLTVTAPVVTPTPTPSGGGGGGGGAPSLWFYAVLGALGVTRILRPARH